MFSFVLPFKTAITTQAHSKRLLKTEHRWEEVAESQEVRTHHHNLLLGHHRHGDAGQHVSPTEFERRRQTHASLNLHRGTDLFKHIHIAYMLK